jgi:autotransporter-associated beta strand protein
VTTAGNLENVTVTSLTGTLTAGASINMLNGVTSTNAGGAITATDGEMRIGNNGTHTLTQTSGSVTTNNWFVVGIGASGAGTFNMSGGTLTSASVNATAFSTIGAGGGTGTVNLSGGTYNDMNKTVLGENAGGTGNFNLSGSGVLHTKQVEVGAGAGNLTFNGGTLRARAASTDFIDSATVTTINAGGGTVDTNGFAVTIADGIAGSGDLTKIGAGALTMSGSNTYTGDTIVSAGTLFVTGALAGEVSVANGATIGGNGTVSGNLTIADGGMIDFSLEALVVNSSSTVSFGGFSLDDVIGFNKETAVNGEYTILAGSFTLDSANIANFGLANAYTRGDGKQVYFQQGSLNIVVVPETSSVLLGLAGSLLLLRRRRN